ncbi:MAG: hypothetical protein ACYTEL_15710 [Planctomycetota bacterium]|jgi:hypothetical protein
MSVKQKAKHILAEMKGHVPFTIVGALVGIVFMLVFSRLSQISSHTLFSVFHPAHVILSALVTASMFKLHAAKKRFVFVLLVGYFGSIGIATLSDIVIPHLGAYVLGLDIPTHAELHDHQPGAADHTETVGEHHHEHEHEHASGGDATSRPAIHLGFIEDWYLVNPAALLGIVIAYFLPRTKFPHAGHVLVSTWASSSYLLMNVHSDITAAAVVGILATLFVAIWVPCCVSDIMFPLLFVSPDLEVSQACRHHWLHSHPHSAKPGDQHEKPK